MKNKFLLLSLLIMTKPLISQQDISLSMYMFNPLFTNPATAGYQDKQLLSAIGRYQWVEVEGAPKSGTISYQTPLKNQNLAIGALVKYDAIGLMKNAGLDVSFAYRLKLTESTRLSLGIMGSLFSLNDLRQTGAQVINQNDPTTFANVNAFLPNFGAGAYLFNKKYFVGASVPHLLKLRIADPSVGSTASYFSKIYNHFFVSAGYVFGPETGIKFKPTAFFKLSDNSSPNIDLNANLLFQERFWVGLGYRSGGDVITEKGQFSQIGSLRGESLIAMIKMLATDKLEIGYAYDYPLSNLNRSTSGSHEIYLGYDLGKSSTGGRFVSPRYVHYF